MVRRVQRQDHMPLMAVSRLSLALCWLRHAGQRCIASCGVRALPGRCGWSRRSQLLHGHAPRVLRSRWGRCTERPRNTLIETACVIWSAVIRCRCHCNAACFVFLLTAFDNFLDFHQHQECDPMREYLGQLAKLHLLRKTCALDYCSLTGVRMHRRYPP